MKSTPRRVRARETRAGLPAPLLDVPSMNPDDPYCFLITPFDQDPERVRLRREGIDPATQRFGFPTYRVDEIPSAGLVIENTRAHITGADFVVAELSGQRPNCYYEVGYAHAIGRPVVHIIKSYEDPQFNVAGLHFLRYDDPPHLRQLLERYILTHVLSTHGPSDDEDRNKGRFGRRAFVDPYIVTGRVRILDTEDDQSSLTCLVDARVRSVDPTRPVKGKVTFVFHESFVPRRYTVKASGGEARCEDIYTYGTFTLGVELHHAGVRLELDLATLPGAGAEFRRR